MRLISRSGEVDKYTWQEVGSSFLPGELIAAFLWAQLEEAQAITTERLAIWARYHEALEALEARGLLRRPVVPAHCRHNAHMYYVVLAPTLDRDVIIEALRQAGIYAVFHYVPLHSSPAGQRYGRVNGSLTVTNRPAEKLLRLPLWVGLSLEQQYKVISVLEEAVEKCAP